MAKSFHCAPEFTLEVLGGKWKTVILCFLKQRPCRYAELRKFVPKLSDKVLTERLADLMAFGLVTRRRSTGAKSGQVYVLTARGLSLSTVLHELYVWGIEHAGPFGAKVGEPLKGLDLS